MMAHHLEAIKKAVIKGKHGEIEGLVKTLIDDKADLHEIINAGMIAAMDEVGRMFAEGEIFVPEMLVSSFTMKKGLDLIKPFLKDEETESKGTVIMCTVKGDIHDIGKNLVCMMLEGAGFRVIDLGVDLTVEKVIQKVQEMEPEILGMSALLTTTMLEMKNVIDTLESKGVRDSVKVMVGGAPVDAAFAKEIKADGYGKDAVEAVQLARGFVPER
ncbi:MAG: corrinoid protein [Desulfobacteraceae bacterium]|jgi:5-methyltetrahydrofolate--homocysteine methyltransferase